MADPQRRDFIKTTGMAAAGLMFVKPGSVYGTPANDAMAVGIIGCGGRGNYIGRELLRQPGVRIVALHDLFDDRLAQTRERFDKEQEGSRIADSMIFKGGEAYHRLLASGIDAVVITSPPYFHPDHFEAAVAAGKHCWLEKPVATDVHGTKRIEKTGQKGAGKVSMTVGFQSHYVPAYEELIYRVHNGAIGDIVSADTNYFTGDLRRKATPGMPAQEARIRNWVFDRVLSGDILVEQNIHVLDVVNWTLRAHPLRAYGAGGKKARLDVDCWDHFAVTYVYPNDVHVSFNSSQFKNSYSARLQRFLGTKGYAEAHFSDGPVKIAGEEPWDAQTSDGFGPGVPRKIAAFVESIRSGKYQNDVPGGVESTLTAILGRTAAYSGKPATWDEVVKSNARWDAQVELT